MVKKDIKTIPFENIEFEYQNLLADVSGGDASSTIVEDFVKLHKLRNQETWEWLGPQLLAHLASYRLPSTQNISARQFLDLNVLGKPRELGIWRFITKVSRSKVMGKQTLPESLPYCALVPLYMAAQKKFNNIPYGVWVRNEVKHLVDQLLWDAVSYDLPADVARELQPQKLVEIRDLGLSVPGKSPRNPKTYHSLSRIEQTALGGMPLYLKAMLTQIWVAHPENRHQYMILDPRNWDATPAPLVSSSVFVAEPKQQEKTFSYDAPW
jgi:hypothetical protein